MGLKINVKNFYSAYIPAVENVLYVVPSGRAAILKSLQICNETSETRTVNVMVARGNGHAHLVPYNFKLSPYCTTYIQDPITMESGARLFASCDLQMSVSLKVNGVEETI